MPYTPEEIKQFEAKDKRINRAAMLKSLIEGLGASGNAYKSYVGDISDPVFRGKLKDAAEDFVDYIYGGTETPPTGENPAINKPKPYQGYTHSLPEPTREQVEILKQVIVKYYDTGYNGDSINVDRLKQAILTEFGKYPTNPASVDVIVDRIPLEAFTN
jgi:hypothetical protein